MLWNDTLVFVQYRTKVYKLELHVIIIINYYYGTNADVNIIL